MLGVGVGGGGGGFSWWLCWWWCAGSVIIGATDAEGRIAEGVSAGGGVLQVGVLGWDRSSGGECKGVEDGGAGVGVLTVGVQVVGVYAVGVLEVGVAPTASTLTTITNRTPTLTPSIPTLKHSHSLYQARVQEFTKYR